MFRVTDNNNKNPPSFQQCFQAKKLLENMFSSITIISYMYHDPYLIKVLIDGAKNMRFTVRDALEKFNFITFSTPTLERDVIIIMIHTTKLKSCTS